MYRRSTNFFYKNLELFQYSDLIKALFTLQRSGQQSFTMTSILYTSRFHSTLLCIVLLDKGIISPLKRFLNESNRVIFCVNQMTSQSVNDEQTNNLMVI